MNISVRKLLSTFLAISLCPNPWLWKTQAAESSGSTEPLTLDQIETEGDTLKIHTSRPTAYNAFTVSNPPRLVLEILNTRYNMTRKEIQPTGSTWLTRIRAGQFQNEPNQIVRVVLDLKEPVEYEVTQENTLLKISLGTTQAKAAPPAPAASPSLPAPGDPIAASAASPGTAGKGTVPPAPTPAPPPVKPSKSIPPGERPRPAPPAPRETPKKADLLASLPAESVTLTFEAMDIRDVFKVLAAKANINIIYGTDVSGQLTLTLTDVPFNEAFRTILAMKGLVTQQVGDNILRILTPQTLSQERSLAVTTTRIFNINYSKANEIKTILDSIRAAEGRKGSITVDDRNNVLIVTDTPEGMEQTARMIAEIDIKPKQVMIEAKLLELSIGKDVDYGILWEYAQTHREGGNQFSSIGQRNPTTEAGVDSAGTAANLPIGASAGGRGAGVALAQTVLPQIAAITFGRVTNNSFLTATLSMAARKGRLKILSNPKVTTLNNKEAKIQVGSKVPTLTTTVTPTGQTQSASLLDVGIILTVTPTVNADRQITIKVKPEASTIASTGGLPGISPAINTRTAETTIMVKDGETIVIGGLIDETEDDNILKVPILGDIPILGWLFKRRSKAKTKRELLVFITPTILED